MISKLDSLVAQTGYIPTTYPPSGLRSPVLGQSEVSRIDGSSRIIPDAHLTPDVKERVQSFRRVGWMMVSAFALIGCAFAFAALWTLWEHPGPVGGATGAFLMAEVIFWIQFKCRYNMMDVIL